MPPILQLSDVCKDFPSGSDTVHALQHVSCAVRSGEFSALAGPSGSGKSTLLHLIAGLTAPSAGHISLAGERIDTLNRSAVTRIRLHKIGFVFQNYSLLPVLTAYENAEYVLLLQGVRATERRQRVTELMQRVGLADKLQRFPRELSGGEQQRVAIVRAIASNPALVLADEPTANLDSANSQSLLTLMAELNQELNITFLFATHDPAVIQQSRRLIRLADGCIDYDGSP